MRNAAAKQSLIVGLGETGVAVARYLRARGERVRVIDSRANPPGLAALRAAVPDAEVSLETLDDQLAAYFGVKEGVLVKSVVSDSAAAKAGLKAGDVITSVNGRHVYEASDVNRALDRMEEADEFTLEVVRDRKPQTVKGKLETRARGRGSMAF